MKATSLQQLLLLGSLTLASACAVAQTVGAPVVPNDPSPTPTLGPVGAACEVSGYITNVATAGVVPFRPGTRVASFLLDPWVNGTSYQRFWVDYPARTAQTLLWDGVAVAANGATNLKNNDYVVTRGGKWSQVYTPAGQQWLCSGGTKFVISRPVANDGVTPVQIDCRPPAGYTAASGSNSGRISAWTTPSSFRLGNLTTLDTFDRCTTVRQQSKATTGFFGTYTFTGPYGTPALTTTYDAKMGSIVRDTHIEAP